MNRLSSLLARIIAVLCAIFFVAAALAALLLFNLERRGFNPNTYKAALVRANFYQSFPSLLGQVLAKNASGSNTPFIKQLTGEDWTAVIQTLLAPEQLRSITEDAITQIFAYLNNETNDPHLSLLSLKQRLSGAAGMDAAVNLIHAQPDCTSAQLAQLIASFGQVLCNPPQNVLNLAKPLIRTQLDLLAASIPDQISLIGTGTAPQGLRNLRVIRLIMQFSPLLPLAFLFGVTLFAVRTFKGWLMWWGWPLLLAGLVGTLSGFSGAPLFRTAIENYISKQTQLTMPPEFTDIVRAVMDEALREMLQPMGWQALIVAGIGFVMLLMALLISRAEKKQHTKKSEAETQIYN